MERLLLKLADRINACDEASLTALWEKYHSRVAVFEPTREWERAVLVLTMLQGVRWKNRLFNTRMDPSGPAPESVSGSATSPCASEPGSGGGVLGQENRSKVLHFRPRQGNEPV
jgi:hypothetical protein